ncbi:MAG: hypothetical protein LPK09_05525, partial [Hymenobacteraceae bacterium]|nr:hypothetical protein [Hymenobacteraceae bacterium]
MKKLFQILTAILLLVLVGCQKPDTAQSMLQNENERQEVYNTILESEEMRNELMAEMRERNMGEGMMGRGGMMQGGGMMGDTTGMGGMHRQQMQARMQQMMALCDSDSTACNEMTRMMLENRALMGNMMKRMRQGG